MRCVLRRTKGTHVVELDRKRNKIVWQCDAKQSSDHENCRIEIHAFQRLADGNALNGEKVPMVKRVQEPNGETGSRNRC